MLELKCTDIDTGRFTYQNLAELTERYPDEENDTLARYLIANNDDIMSTCTQLNKAISLREEYSAIRKESCFNEIAKGSAYLHGHDKEGRPLLIVHARMHDPENRVLKESVLMTLWWTEQAIAQLPDNYSRFTILLDRDNCENAVDTEYMQALAEVFVHLHPERLQRAIVYPTGIVFYSMWNLIIKWFMAESTREKVFPAVSLGDVQALIDDRFIPASLGGSSHYAFNMEDFSDPLPRLGGCSEKTTLPSAGSSREARKEGSVCGEGEQNDLNSSSNASLSFSMATTSESPDSAKHLPQQEYIIGKLALQEQTETRLVSLNSDTENAVTEEAGMTCAEVKRGKANAADRMEGAEERKQAPVNDKSDAPTVLQQALNREQTQKHPERQSSEGIKEQEAHQQIPFVDEEEEDGNVWVEVSSQSGEEDDEVAEREEKGRIAGQVSGESYHYNAQLSPADGCPGSNTRISRMPRPFPEIDGPLSPADASRSNSAFISAAGSAEASEEGDCWQEVGSVESDTSPGSEVAEEGAQGRTAAVIQGSILNREDSSSRTDNSTVPVPTMVAAVAEKADALLTTANVHMSLSALWCAAVALVVGMGMYSTYYPDAPSSTVSVAFLARLALFALLLCCFL